jgi:hypothetical protein
MLLDPQELLKQKNISDFLEENRKNAKIQKLIKQLAKSSKSDYGELQSAYLSRKLLETIFPQEMPLIQVDYKNKYIYILGMIEGIISRDDQEIDISEIYKKYIAPILIESEKEEDKKIHDHLLHFVIEKQLFRFLDKKSREIIDKLFVEKINYNEDYGMKLLRKINTSV